MPRAALTHDARGAEVIPTTDAEWDDWVSASATRNYVLDDPLLDWLDRYGEAKGFPRDDVDQRTDYRRFIARKASEFERAVVEHLRILGVGEVRAIIGEHASYRLRRELAAAEATWEAMADAVPIIWRGTLRDATSRTYGFPTLLVRSDTFTRLFSDMVVTLGAPVAAPGLDIGHRHYVILDIVYSTLELLKDGSLSNSDARPAYKVRTFMHNQMLGRLQGYCPSHAYSLGRGWRQTVGGETNRGGNCMELLAPVGNDDPCRRVPLAVLDARAVKWIRDMRRHGEGWEVLPEPSVDELRPNASSSARGNADAWASAIQRIVADGEDLTRLWSVGVGKRREANARGLTRWSDKRVTPAAIGITGPKQEPTLRALLEVNRDDGPAVRPGQIVAERAKWIEVPPLEFYVDYETVNDLDDDFTRIPHKNGQPLIFMIGCGHVDQGHWHFDCFVADHLTESAEVDVIDRWLHHMAEVRDRLALGTVPKIIHWSAHETTSLVTAYNAAVERHPNKRTQWRHRNWFDFLKLVIQEEPVVVRGAHGFGLKAVTNALCDLGHITTRWETGPTDGLGAMVGAWWCQHQVENGRARRLIDLDLMNDIRDYNEVDCKAMMEIVRYLRKNH